MKMRGSWGKFVKFVGVTGLVCGLLLLTPFRGAVKRMHQPRAGLSPVPANTATNVPRPNADPKLLAAYGKLPLRFEENQGQTNSEVRFVSHGSGYELFLTPQDAVLALRSTAPQHPAARNHIVTLRESRTARLAERSSAVRIHLEGANSAPRITGVDPLPGKTNYFIGNDPKKWHTDVPNYARVKYEDIYPGVDLDFYGNQRRLEYDFVVAPGASPNAIRLHLEGAQKMRLNAQGDLELSVPGGELVLQKPVVYQLVGGERHEIAGSYAVSRGNEIAFSVPPYDRSKPLVLDPVLNYSTYLGGSAGASVLGTGVDQGFGIALDTAGNSYVAGATFSTDFPTPAAVKGFQKGPLASNAGGAAFVSEIDPTGTTLLYSSYIAGSTPGEIAQGIAVDSTGKIYLTGQTLSTDFPTSSTIAGLKPGPNAGAAGGTSFIVKLDPAQTGAAGLVYSSYLGGTSGDIGEGIAVDAKGNAYVTGLTLSPPGSGGAVTNLADFPVTAGAFQSVLNSPNGNAFLARIDTTQAGTASLIYSTYLGGSDVNIATAPAGFGDTGFGVAVDGSNNAYIVGTTISDDFPTTAANALRSTKPLAITNGNNTVFVSKINTAPNANPQLVYSTYLGGEVSDFGTAIALGPNNVAYVTGSTSSLAFRTFPATPFQTTGHTSGVAFISLIDTGKIGSLSLQYSTYLGGTGTDAGNAIAADAQGNAYIAGKTSSNVDFPIIAGALQPVYPGAGSAGFISKLNPGNKGQADLLYSTYFGGSGGGGANQDQIHAIALDASNPPNVFVTGETFSATKFPIFPAGAFQTTLKGTSDAFIAKLTLIPTLVVSPTSLDFGTVLIGTATPPTKSVTLTNNTNAAIAFTSAVVNGNPVAANTDYTVTNSCSGSIPFGATNTCTVSVTFKPTVVGAETATLQLTDSDSTSPQTISLTGAGTNTAPDFTLTGPTTTQTVKDGATLTFQVTVTPIGGFKSAVAFTCTGAPALATCTAPSVTPDGVNPISSTVTVTTTALLVPPPSPRTPPVSIRQIVPLVLALLLLFLLPRAQRLRTRLGMATAVILFIALAGCSGPQKPHTPTGPATLTITGTSGALSHPVTVNITVN
jgi:Abnormal spindle-like microcephaly-assoc'd, ASPM-SPD-2-Hydin/Beta-propeller repeat